MKCFKRFTAFLFSLFIIFAGCAGSQNAAQRSEKRPATLSMDQPPQTLAILPFENNSVTDSNRFAPLSKGLPAMIITDLNKNGAGLKLIERDKIQALLKEIAFGQTGGVDETKAVQVGKILGAQAIALGAFMVLGEKMRIDVRIIKVETSELILAESIVGESDDFMRLEQVLTGKIAESLKVSLRPRETMSKSGIDAALYFSKGLNALDRGDRAEAIRLFSKCVELDPAYKVQIENIKSLN